VSIIPYSTTRRPEERQAIFFKMGDQSPGERVNGNHVFSLPLLATNKREQDLATSSLTALFPLGNKLLTRGRVGGAGMGKKERWGDGFGVNREGDSWEVRVGAFVPNINRSKH